MAYIKALEFARRVNEERLKLIENAMSKGVQEITTKSSLSQAVAANNTIEPYQEGMAQEGEIKKARYIDPIDGVFKVEYLEKEQFENFPSPLEHDGLSFVGWTYGMKDVSSGNIDIGAIYEPADGKSHLFITLDSSTGLTVSLSGVSGTINSINWGDGTSDTNKTHTYASEGDYEIVLDMASGWSITSYIFGSGSNNEKIKLIKAYLFGTLTIGKYTFDDCYSLNFVVIPNSVISIGEFAFYNCYSLKSVVIPDSVTSINRYAFSNCYSLKSVVIPDSVTSIDSSAFSICRSLQSVVINSDISNSTSNAFSACYSLQSVTISNSVTSIGSSTFYNCYSLQSVTISNSVTSIGELAFYNCYSLKSIVIPDSVTSIGSYTFYNCYSLKSIVIPDSVTSIGSNAFSACYSLQSVTISNNVVSIGGSTFSDCYSLKSVVIPDSVTSIDSEAFYNCYSLKSVVIPDSVTSIGGSAFSNCYSLKDYVIECRAVPTLGSSAALCVIPQYTTIWVNDNIIDDLKTATNWVAYASYMKPLSEKPLED